jgi:rhodanese-related sulfurtransferase
LNIFRTLLFEEAPSARLLPFKSGLPTCGEKFVLIDLRPAKEFQEKRILGSRSIPSIELDKRIGEIPKSGRVVVYAATPQNEIVDSVFEVFEDNKYRNVTFMLEGFQGWLKLKYPIETGPKK